MSRCLMTRYHYVALTDATNFASESQFLGLIPWINCDLLQSHFLAQLIPPLLMMFPSHPGKIYLQVLSSLFFGRDLSGMLRVAGAYI
jgi:hypothetical protein